MEREELVPRGAALYTGGAGEGLARELAAGEHLEAVPDEGQPLDPLDGRGERAARVGDDEVRLLRLREEKHVWMNDLGVA